MQPRSTTELGKTLEDRVAELYGGIRSKSSGAAAGRKGDVSYEIVVDQPEWHGVFNFIAECKVTEAKSFSLKKETWDKVAREARDAGRRPSMFVRFYNRDSGKHIDLVIRSIEDDTEMVIR